MSEPTITHDNNRYRITVDGAEAGFADYRDSGDRRDFHHTEIDKAFGGQGLAGKLTIKGKTKDVVVPATFTPQGSTGVFSGSLTIQRGDFAVGEGAWKAFDIVANDVVIKFRITAAGK